MELFHATDETGMLGIREYGFAVSDVGDSAGHTWFCSDRADCDTAGTNREWLVIVEMPEPTAAPYRSLLEDGTPYLSCYRIPWAVVNAYRPFRRERLQGGSDARGYTDDPPDIASSGS